MAIIDGAGGVGARRGPRLALAIVVGLVLAAPGRAEAQQLPQRVACASQHWVGSWSTSQDNADTALEGQTGRMMISPHWGGDRTRIRLSNELSATPVKLASIHIGKRATGAAVKDGTQTPITFAGADEITIPAGAGAISDPVDFSFDAFEPLAVSYYVVPAFESKATGHFNAEQQSYLAMGDVAADPSGDAFLNGQTSWWYLDGIDVLADAGVSNLVLFGDSITEGFQSTTDAQARYPDVLARRMAEAGIPLAVLNEGLSGNRILHDGIASPIGGGLRASTRFGRDALTAPAPSSVVVLVGINDIGHPAILLDPSQAVTAAQIIDGLADIARQATAAGLAVYGGTLTPSGDLTGPSPLGPNYSSPEANAKRREVNDWIRTTEAFDGVIDFDAMLRDPAAPEHLRAEYNSGDSLHPNDAGYAAIADGIDITGFPVHPCTAAAAADPVEDGPPGTLPATGRDEAILAIFGGLALGAFSAGRVALRLVR